ncbi:MAG: ribose 5-phosphate isomerase B [Malacoplasma sp.]|nr:ribose 5-phosphate isomerase B [Malacoplasma sp.]MDE6646049.1 ribose 5-phosphate isomerase B [Malacoplasma sp.]MDE6893957.1 ribose 5-phosphate isomerase B [Malacoplasma sp.]MDE7075371.1 ribose 5-phosphate isomerase B [Malacoplasma sp.]
MNQSQNASQKIRVYIGSDHGGFLMKENLKKVNELNCFIDFIDVGTYSEDSVDYPDYAKKIADKVLEDKDSYGIGICGTGIGICIALNKIKGIYAANVNKVIEAELAKEHNNVNVITLSGRFSTLEENVSIVKKFFSSTFQEGRHKQRLEKIKKMEEKNE